MKLLFISDLHFGCPLFRAYRKVMSILDGEYDKIFILGDIIDTWEDTTENIVIDNKRIIAKINSLDNVVIVKGNHDPSMFQLGRIFYNADIVLSYKCEVDGKTMIMVHGDECDDLVFKHSWLARVLFPIHWVCERFGINLKGFFRELYYSISMKVDKKYYNDLVLDIEKDLVSKYKDKCDCLIFGHTHVPKLGSKDGTMYVNCGDWVWSDTYVVYKDGMFELIK